MPIHVIVAAGAIAASVPLLLFGVSAHGGTLSSVGLLARLRRQQRPSVDMHQITLERSAGDRVLRPVVSALAGRFRSLTPRGWARHLERKVELAGMGDTGVELFLAMKLVVVVAAIGVLLLVAGHPRSGVLLPTTFVAAALFFVAPDVSLASRAKTRQEQIQIDLPDVLDQMMISVEAGLGFEAALARAGKTGTGPLAAEIVRSLQEMQMGLPRRQALNNLALRTDVPDLRNFVFAVVQSEQYGLPIAHTLRVQAAELRDKRRQRAEERAFKVPVKITFPLIFCIFPSLFIVLLGPAAIRMWKALFG